MRKTLATVAMVLALCCTAFAGEIHTPGAPTPPPDSTQTQSDPVTTDTLTQIVLIVLTSALP